MKKVMTLIAIVLLALTGCRPKEPTWQDQYDLGIRYLSDSNYEEAILAFHAAIEIDPKQPDPYIGLADAYCAVEDYETAESVLEEAALLVSTPEVIEAKLEEVQKAYIFVGTRQVDNEDGSYTIYEYNDNGDCIFSSFHSTVTEEGYFITEYFFDPIQDSVVLRRQTNYNLNGNILSINEWNEDGRLSKYVSYTYDPSESRTVTYIYEGKTVYVDIVYNYFYQGSKTLTASGAIQMESEENHVSYRGSGRIGDEWSHCEVAEYDKTGNVVNEYPLVEDITG